MTVTPGTTAKTTDSGSGTLALVPVNVGIPRDVPWQAGNGGA